MSKFGKFSVNDDTETSSTVAPVERVKVGIQLRKDLKTAVAIAAAKLSKKEYEIYEEALQAYLAGKGVEV